MAAWYNSNWSDRIPLVVDSDAVDATLTDSPVFVDLSDLPSAVHAALLSSGADIRITTSDGQTEVPVDLVKIDTSGETGELHFKAPSLSSSADTTFYLYYGNSGASAPAPGDTYGRNNVWGDYDAVWHLVDEDNDWVGEYGEWENSGNSTIDGGEYRDITFQRTYTDPVVVAFVATNDGSQSVVARVSNVSGSGARIFLEEPDNETGHNSEIVFWMVIEAGQHTINGCQVEAGTHDTSNYVAAGGSFSGDSISFSSSFGTTPAVLHSLMTRNNGEFATSTVDNVSTTGFDAEIEVGGTGHTISGDETIGWIAFETGNFGWFEVGVDTPGSNFGNDDTAHTINYDFNWNVIPNTIVSLNTRNGSDGAWARGASSSASLGGNSFAVYGEEDQVGDSERGHTSEDIAWIVMVWSSQADPPHRLIMSDDAALTDSTGNGHDATFINNMAKQAYSTGLVSTEAPELDGGADGMVVSEDSALEPTTLPIYISAIAYKDSTPASADRIIQVGSWNGLHAQYTGYKFDVDSSHTLGFSYGDSTGGGSGGRRSFGSSNTAPNGSWYHFAVHIAAPTTGTFYINGVSEAASSTSGSGGLPVYDSGLGVQIGLDDYGDISTNSWDGRIDELRIRTASITNVDAWYAFESLNLTDPTSAYSVGSIESLAKTATHNTDAILHSQGTATHTTDAFLRDNDATYTYESNAALPTDDNLLTNGYDDTDYSDVDADDNNYKDFEGSNYVIEQFWLYNDNSTDNIEVTWRGKSTIAPSSSTVYLQIYNQDTNSWETLDSDSSTGADTEFALTGEIDTDVADYYDTGNRIAARVYQQAV